MSGLPAVRLTKRFVRSWSALAIWVAIFGLVVISGQTPAIVGPYTAAQSEAGRVAYLGNCASCHLAELTGRNEAPQLAGSNFVAAWGGRTTSELLTYIQTTMPPGNSGGLAPETYVNLVAFLLEANGASAGSQPLTSKTASAIRSAATGHYRLIGDTSIPGRSSC